MFRSMIAALWSLVMTGGTLGLKLMSLDVPSAVMQGDSAWLNCTLDLESDDLYSVKWYKDDVEFYRHLPQDSPSGQKYDIPGIRLDELSPTVVYSTMDCNMLRTNQCKTGGKVLQCINIVRNNPKQWQLQKSVQGHVYLTKANLDTEGIYRCEASAESPTFQTVEAEKPLKVFVIPQEDPEIVGSQSRYEVGDYVNVTCKSGPSKPAAVLKWYINGKVAEPGLEISYPIVDHANGLQTSLLGLWFMVKPKDLFQGGAITLKCTATVSQTYSTSSEELIVGEKFVGTAPAMNTLTVIAKDGPLITGGQTQYRVGQILNLNCSSAKSRPAPQLQWYLNEESVSESHLVRYPDTVHVDGDETSVLGLRMRVRPDHLDENGEVRLKCTATLSRVINVRSDERTLGGNHRNSGLQVAENYGKVSERSSRSSQLTFHAIFEVVAVSTLLVLL